ncbi:MAG: HAMP domain-containing sensor histidine kinase [Polyangiaceae bacterium]
MLQNAFKFSKPSTLVTLTARATDRSALIQVEDHCGGLSPGKEDSLLQPFVQRGEDRSGLVLGLSICAKAMQSMNGDLHVKDLPDKGCIFTLDIPRRHAAPSPVEG